MGTRRKKAGAGAVVPVPVTQSVVSLDRAFNDGRGRTDMNDILIDAEETIRRFDDSDSVYDNQTGISSQSSESIFNDFLDGLRAAQRADGTWDVKALEELARARGADYGGDYGYPRFNETSVAITIDDYNREIRNLLNSVRAEGAGAVSPELASAARPIFGAERRPSAAREMAQVIADRSEDLRMRVVSALQTRNGLNDSRVRSEMRGLLALISRAQETFEIGKSVDQLIAQADRLYDAYQNAGTFDRPRLAQQTNRARAAAARAAQDFDRFDRRPITDADLGRADQRLTIVSQMIDDARRRNIPTPVARIVEELTSTSPTRYEFGTTPPRQPAPRAARAPSAPRAPRKPRGGGLL